MFRISTTITRILAASCLLIVFIIDIVTPSEFVVDILYLSSIMIIFKQSTRTIIGFGIAACLLIFISGMFFDHTQTMLLSMWINRSISIFAIASGSYIAVHYRKVSDAGKLKQNQNTMALKEMLFMLSHRVRKPVANILGLIQVVEGDFETMTAEDLREYCNYVKSSVNELDNFVIELNEFISQTKNDSQEMPGPDQSRPYSSSFVKKTQKRRAFKTSELSTLS